MIGSILFVAPSDGESHQIQQNSSRWERAMGRISHRRASIVADPRAAVGGPTATFIVDVVRPSCFAIASPRFRHLKRKQMALGIRVCVLVGEHHRELSAAASLGSMVGGGVVAVERLLDGLD
jgi:hypothetical protein